MRGLIAGTIVLVLLLMSCGGGSSVPGGSEFEQNQQQTLTPEQPAVEQDGAVTTPQVQEPAADPGATIPEGATAVALSRETMESVVLPPIDPGLLVPEDNELPDLWLANFAQGATLHGKVYMSVLSVDNTGTNFIAMLIGSELTVQVDNMSLEYTWDTRQTADGWYELIFIVRDNGNNTGLCRIQIEIDNTSDWGPPEIMIDPVTSFFDGMEYATSQEYHGYPTWYIANQAELTIKALDGSPIDRIALYLCSQQYDSWRKPGELHESVWENAILVDSSDNKVLQTSLNASEWGGNRHLRIVACDIKGETANFDFQLIPVNTASMRARFTTLQQESALGTECFLLPGDWTPGQGTYASQAIASCISTYYGWVGFQDLPIGTYQLVAVYKDAIIQMTYVNPPGGVHRIPPELTVFDTYQ